MVATEMSQELWQELTSACDRSPRGLWFWFAEDEKSNLYPPPSKALWDTLIARYVEQWGEDPHIKPERIAGDWIPFDCQWVERMNELEFFRRVALKNDNEDKYKLISSQIIKVYEYGMKHGLLTWR